jgi:hypothetical protein
MTMVWLFGMLLSLPIIYGGWVFYSNPQRGYRIHNWPFGPSPGRNGLTEAGKTPYRVRGAVVMALGVLLLLISLFANA